MQPRRQTPQSAAAPVDGGGGNGGGRWNANPVAIPPQPAPMTAGAINSNNNNKQEPLYSQFGFAYSAPAAFQQPQPQQHPQPYATRYTTAFVTQRPQQATQPSPAVVDPGRLQMNRTEQSVAQQMADDYLLTDAIFPLTIDTDMVYDGDGGNDVKVAAEEAEADDNSHEIDTYDVSISESYGSQAQPMQPRGDTDMETDRRNSSTDDVLDGVGGGLGRTDRSVTHSASSVYSASLPASPFMRRSPGSAAAAVVNSPDTNRSRTVSPGSAGASQRPPIMSHQSQAGSVSTSADSVNHNNSSSAWSSFAPIPENDAPAAQQPQQQTQIQQQQQAIFALGSHSFPGTSFARAPKATRPAAASSEDIFSTSTDTAPAADLQKHAVVLEKRRKRRESHNAVERRRRDNINERIQELATIVPDCLDLSGPVPASGVKPHKGDVLRKSTDYIRALQRHNEELRLRVDLLTAELARLKGPEVDFAQPASDFA